jgi:hypothetical protein
MEVYTTGGYRIDQYGHLTFFGMEVKGLKEGSTSVVSF